MFIHSLSSLQNPKVKLARTLSQNKGRREAGLFLVEGTKLLREALNWGFAPVTTFATDAWWNAHHDEAPFTELRGEAFEVPETLLQAIATTQTPDAVVALVPLPEPKTLELPPDALVVIAHRLQDPGNLGTIIRTADAAGAHAVVVTDQTVDPFSPKVVRATMGGLFHLPVVRMTLADWKAEHPNLPVYATTLNDATSLYSHDFKAGAAFLIGNEGAGLSPEDEVLADHRIRIPIPGNAESLNAAMAATICLYEAVRQRL